MNVGLPGTGIGGLFYIATALLMPFFELIQLLRGRSSAARWRCVTAQFGMAVAIFASLWATAWTLNRFLPESLLIHLRLATQQINDLLGVTPTLVTLVTLGGVLLAVELFAFFFGRSAQREFTLEEDVQGRRSDDVCALKQTVGAFHR
ncbi:MAG: hypothetical protein HY282_14360 [Nitrospirae bacterium]|nr:hypothetical protein [Candidatus Manganitrophaceae bacterium]